MRYLVLSLRQYCLDKKERTNQTGLSRISVFGKRSHGDRVGPSVSRSRSPTGRCNVRAIFIGLSCREPIRLGSKSWVQRSTEFCEFRGARLFAVC